MATWYTLYVINKLKGAVHLYCLLQEAAQVYMISQPVKSLK